MAEAAVHGGGGGFDVGITRLHLLADGTSKRVNSRGDRDTGGNVGDRDTGGNVVVLGEPRCGRLRLVPWNRKQARVRQTCVVGKGRGRVGWP